jgi:hypothetical protein
MDRDVQSVPGEKDGIDGGHSWILFEDSESNGINGDLAALGRLWCLETLKISSNFVDGADLRLTLKFVRHRSSIPEHDTRRREIDI